MLEKIWEAMDSFCKNKDSRAYVLCTKQAGLALSFFSTSCM